MNKPYLALFRAGPTSLHPQAIERLPEQTFDYALSWFGQDAPEAPGAKFVHMQSGAKWPGLYATLKEYWPVISQYRYVWLPDDDLLCVPEDVSRMFMICQDLNLELAQPALTHESYFSHVITLQHKKFQVRFTNFVEIMAPIFSIDMLGRVLETMRGTISGWGLDYVWPRMSSMGSVAIIDETPVFHTRPVGGPNYKLNKAAGLNPVHEQWLASATHFVQHSGDVQVTYGGLLQDGDTLCFDTAAASTEKMLLELMLSISGAEHMTATQLTAYLSSHLYYANGDLLQHLQYPRGMVRVVLNRELRDSGLKFGSAASQVTAVRAAA